MPGSDLRRNVMRKRYTLNPGVDIAGVYFDGHKDIDIPGVNIEGPLEGTLQNPEQPNITTVGTLTNLVVESKEIITGRNVNDILPPPLPPPALTVKGDLELNGELLMGEGATLGSIDDPITDIFVKNKTITFVNDDKTKVELTGDSLTPNSIPGHEFTFNTNLAVEGGKTFTCDKLFASKIDATGNICTNKKFIGDVSANNISGINLDLTGNLKVEKESVFTGDFFVNSYGGHSNAVRITTNATTNEKITIQNMQGQADDSITIKSNAGGVKIDSGNGGSFTTSAGALRMQAADDLELFAMGGNKVDISGAKIDLTGDLTVTGASVFTGDISANDISGANINLTGQITVDGDAEFRNKLFAVDISGTTFRGKGPFDNTISSAGTGLTGGGGAAITDTSEFNGFTIFQIVNCLKEFGFLK